MYANVCIIDGLESLKVYPDRSGQFSKKRPD
jgi:hypothetical protein